jgi:WD40 repeat protein/serine/threonine protein kinase
MVECPFCRGALEAADLHAKKCLVCGNKLPQGLMLDDPIEEPGATRDDYRIESTIRDLQSIQALNEIPGSPSRNEDRAGEEVDAWAGQSTSESSDEPQLVIQPRVLAEAGSPVGLAADYEIVGKLGQGGMGIVLTARQASVNRSVALKKISTERATDPESRRKFLTEAVVTGELEHPNIVPIYDLGKDESGLLFYSMKHVKGTPWDQVIHQKTIAENLEILMKVADAVAFAHSRNVIHRDLKPENVMLGGYGEVLVMDWGLAVKLDSPAASAAGLGGTPAYMAPEMVFTRPAQIGFAADVYLLGAILYEIITGNPPHEGATVTACVSAASQNLIRPTEKSDELVTISLKAMSTLPADRHASVGDFQEAIRLYWSHSQSVLLSDRANEDLIAAAGREDYDRYARALLEFQEAFELWEGNTRAKEGIAETSVAYARRALSKGNFELAASLLDETNLDQAPLLREIQAAQKEQDARQQRLKTAKRIGAFLVATILVVVTVAFFWIKSEYNRAEKAKIAAQESANSAIKEKKEAERQQSIAVSAKEEAVHAKNSAEASRAAEAQATHEALDAKKVAEDAKKVAEDAKDAAEKAKKKAEDAKQQEEYGAYIARIGLAAAKIDDNAFGMAGALLRECPDKLRNWEWGRLINLCRQSDRNIDVPERIETLALSLDGKRLVTGGLGGTARLWDAGSGKELLQFRTGGQYIFAAAFSPDGKHVALGTNDRPAYLKIYDTATGNLAWEYRSQSGDGTPRGHQDAILSVVYSRDGKRLLTSSYDNTARLWDLEKPEEIRVFRGHDWWVWSAAFSPDERWIVTASQDGSAIVWDAESGAARVTFRGHAGPVYNAVFAPGNGNQPAASRRRGEREPIPGLIASGGYDKRVILWAPDKVRDFDFGLLTSPVDSGVSAGDARVPAEIAVLQGHTSGVRAVRFSDDGQLLATGSDDNTVRIWNVASGQIVKVLRGHGGRVHAVAFTPGGQGEDRGLISGGYDQQVKIWDLERYEEMRILPARSTEGHHDAILGAAFSPDGQQIVTAGRDRTARLWDRRGQAILEFKQGHQYLASTAVFFPDRQRVLTAAMDGTTRVWDLASGGQLLLLPRTGASAAVALSHDSKWILTGGDADDARDSTGLIGPDLAADAVGDRLWLARLWDAKTGELARTFTGHHAEITAVAFSFDDQFAFTGDSNGRGRLWDLKSPATGGTVQKIHARGITAAVFLPHGSGLLTASGDNTVAQWDVATGAQGLSLSPRQVLRHPDAVSSVAASADGSFAVTTCADETVRLWDLERGEITAMILAGRGHSVQLMDAQNGAEVLQWRESELAKLRERRRLTLSAISGGQSPGAGKQEVDREIRRLDELEQLVTGKEVINSAAFSPDGSLVVTTSTNGDVRLWDWRGRREIGGGPRGPIPTFRSPGGQAWSTAFSPNGEYLVTVGGRDAYVWKRSDGSEVIRLGPQGAVASARFSPDGGHVVTASWDNAARIWNAKTGQLERELQGHTEYVNDAVFSRDGKCVLTASDDKTAILWDAETGKRLGTFKGHTQRIRSASLLCDGQSGRVLKAMTASDDATVCIWDVHGTLLHEFKGHTKAVLDAKFSPDGKHVLSGGDDNRAILWDSETGAILQTLDGHTAGVTSVAFSPDDARAITGSRDNSVKVWELRSGKELLTLKGHSQEVTGVCFSPDQKTVLTCGLDGTWIQWQASDWGSKDLSRSASNPVK